jgi:murein DD-endopeptidase MepM/ murein hydrolase activator NlpD
MRRRGFLAGFGASVALAALPVAARTVRPGEGDSARSLQDLVPRGRLAGLATDGIQTVVRLSTSRVYQGGALLVSASPGSAGTASLFGRSYALEPGDDGIAGFVSIGTEDTPGETEVVVSVQREDGEELFTRTVTVLKTNWTVDYLEIPPPTGDEPNPLDPAEGIKESQRLGQVYSGLTPRVWRDRWVAPVLGTLTADRISAYFGEQRSINGGPVQGHHGGTDITSGFGAPIVATNDGTVVLSDRLVVRGNMVIIDHGGGVFSGYGHLSERSVAVGDTVAQGEVIGAEGMTGLVTGPHLHWEMSVGGVLVDGLRWLDGTQGF